MCFLGKEVFFCEFESESSGGHVCIVIPETFFVSKEMTSGICRSFPWKVPTPIKNSGQRLSSGFAP